MSSDILCGEMMTRNKRQSAKRNASEVERRADSQVTTIAVIEKKNRVIFRRKVYLFFLLPSLIGMIVLFAAPFFDVVRRSFTYSMGDAWIGLANYQSVIENQAFRLAVINTSLFIAVSIPLLIVFSFCIAMFIRRQHIFKDLFKAGFLLPLVIPVAAVALLWQLLFDYSGMLNGILIALGFGPQSWLDSNLAFWVLVFGYLWRNLGFSMVLWLVALEGISPNLYEAAQLDGAGKWAMHRHITLPLVAPACFTIVALAIINSFKVFREAFLVAGSYPHESMYTIQHLFNNWFGALVFDKISAAATLISIVLFLLVLVLYKTWGLGGEHQL